MRLTIATPLAVVVDEDDVRHVRAEDATGAFGVLPGHAELLTVLVPSLLSWRLADGSPRHAAVRGGLLTVRRDRVDLASREAVVSEDLDELEHAVLRHFREEDEDERRARAETARFEAEALRRITQALRRKPQPPPRLGRGS